ncbi:MAG: hypothetical protein R3C69_05905 [Geminicoccaceae bacterium]
MGKSGLDVVKVGDRYAFARTVGESDVMLFAGLTGDFSDTHVNEQYMRERSNSAAASRTVPCSSATCRPPRP